MIALQDFSTATPATQMLPSFAPMHLPQRSAAAARPEPERRPGLSCVTAAELKQHVASAFSAAGDWFTLCRALRRKGLCLRMRGEDLWLFDAASLTAISCCEDLGIDPMELELRFGPSQPQRPSAQAA
ncbi:hypothetical protein K3553_16110 [Leisingera aquaemixtae]|uniref:hypothetical protein n=1 Tax=Leisingera aquaemixtae TaxID=1396826 RepID=UPI0021A89A9A|nr:hypothetical protein [Leisingera aquaemixtae]UWQ24454.1 hypothetical protein K3553_16110 [Leisingera aquaemixtae]